MGAVGNRDSREGGSGLPAAIRTFHHGAHGDTEDNRVLTANDATDRGYGTEANEGRKENWSLPVPFVFFATFCSILSPVSLFIPHPSSSILLPRMWERPWRRDPGFSHRSAEAAENDRDDSSTKDIELKPSEHETLAETLGNVILAAYDHDIPFFKGGSSLTTENVRLLCGKHNLQKSGKIMSLLPWVYVGTTAIRICSRN